MEEDEDAEDEGGEASEGEGCLLLREIMEFYCGETLVKTEGIILKGWLEDAGKACLEDEGECWRIREVFRAGEECGNTPIPIRVDGKDGCAIQPGEDGCVRLNTPLPFCGEAGEGETTFRSEKGG